MFDTFNLQGIKNEGIKKMILKISEKTNKNGWRRQIIIDFDNKTIKTGAFLFHSGDVDGLTHKQYKQTVEYFINQGFKKEGV